MKNTRITFLSIFAFLLISATSCQKDMEVQPNGTIERQASVTKEDITVIMIMGSDEYMQGEEAYFEAYVLNSSSPVDCGKFTLQKFNSNTAQWENIKAAQNLSTKNPVYIIKSVKLSYAGTYRWQYNAPNGCKFNSTVTGGLAINVI